jgi:amino acid transporter
VLAVLILLSLAVLNLRGVGHAGRFQAAVTTLKVIGLFGLIVGVLVWGHAAGTSTPSYPDSAAVPMGSRAFSAALLGAMVAFNGFGRM